MAFEQRSLDDYIDVAQRIADFRDQYPEGSLRPWNDAEPWRLVQAEGFDKDGSLIHQSFIVVVAAAYRHGLDDNPGVGMAWEIFPGRTPYTRGSELQNAETSAWGRAIIAVGASDSKRGIASREEVRNRQAEREPGLEQNLDINSPNFGGVTGQPLPRNADGSLSRSRTSDAEKQAAGVMTDAEQRAHNALAKPPPNTQPVDRFFGEGGPLEPPVDDRWTTDAPSWLVGVDPPEDQPGSILPAQRSQIMAVYTALGIKDRTERIADVNAVLGLNEVNGPWVTSTNDLSHQQAARLLENLHERHTGKMTRR